MKELYKFINIPNFEVVQRELLESINYDYASKGLHAQNFSEEHLTTTCPTLMSWLKSRSKIPFRLLRFYFTPAYSEQPKHIDSNFIPVPFGLNIPVLNCHNTKMTWYNCSEENKNDYVSDGIITCIFPKDVSKLEVIEELELVRPCFTRNDVMHNVKNFNNSVRIMFSVRWALHTTKFRTIDEVMDTTDLFA